MKKSVSCSSLSVQAFSVLASDSAFVLHKPVCEGPSRKRGINVSASCIT